MSVQPPRTKLSVPCSSLCLQDRLLGGHGVAPCDSAHRQGHGRQRAPETAT